MTQSLQEQHAPTMRCFGCGPANDKGLQLRSIVNGDQVHCEWQPQEHHEAFPGMLNGGIIGALLDCHCNWTAAWQFMKQRGDDHPPATVTAEYTIRLERPTPTKDPVFLKAWVEESSEDRATVHGTLEAGGKITATCQGLFVAVKEGHPAFHRW